MCVVLKTRKKSLINQSEPKAPFQHKCCLEAQDIKSAVGSEALFSHVRSEPNVPIIQCALRWLDSRSGTFVHSIQP